MSSEHDRDHCTQELKQPWSPVQDLYKIQPISIPAQNGRGSWDPPQAEELLTIDGFWGEREREPVSIKAVTPGKLTMLQ